MIEKRRGPTDDRYDWEPFEPSDRFTPEWWDRTPYHDDDPWFVQVLRDGEEVARLELDPEVHIDHYAGTPHLGRAGLDIPFFEVSATHRLRGIGTAVIAALTATHPDRRFVALSEEADGFWASLGWERFMHATDPHYYRPLYVQPPHGSRR